MRPIVYAKLILELLVFEWIWLSIGLFVKLSLQGREGMFKFIRFEYDFKHGIQHAYFGLLINVCSIKA